MSRALRVYTRNFYWQGNDCLKSLKRVNRKTIIFLDFFDKKFMKNSDDISIATCLKSFAKNRFLDIVKFARLLLPRTLYSRIDECIFNMLGAVVETWSLYTMQLDTTRL